MTKDNNNGLIHRPTTEITKQGGGTSPVIARMSQDVLDRANARFRLGEYLLREPDYNQILLWAEAMEMSPEEVLEHLCEGMDDPRGDDTKFVVEHGSIVSVVWDFNCLPLLPNTWLDGLRVRALYFYNQDAEVPDALAPRLAQLQDMRCEDLNLTALDLSLVPGLTKLSCNANQLTTLDLSLVPKLTELWCPENKLTTLDLSLVPKLTELWCSENQITALDLSLVPELTELSCWGIN